MSESRRVLRVIIDGARDPRMNMALDEALARARERKSFDTLRVYMWLPSGVSIGRRQRVEDTVYLDEIRRRGYVLVRRPTGGAALLHPQDKELTYSIVLSKDDPLYKLDVSSSAAKIAEAIAHTINILLKNEGGSSYDETYSASVRGLPEISNISSAGFCYINPGSSDVMIRGRKISGSAQRRDWGSLLQHGTILLKYDPEDFLSVLKVSDDDKRDVFEKIAGLSDFIKDLSLQDLIDNLIRSFQKVLKYDHVFIGGFDLDEIVLAKKLFDMKYSSEKWIFYGEDLYGEV